MLGLSIIICCYNSAIRLPDTLRHLAAQLPIAADWEVVVVDNNSTDNTAEVAYNIWQQLGAPVSMVVVTEPKPGLVYARERGLAASTYDLILFCDDDNWLDKKYISTAWQLMTDKSIGVLGGLSLAVADVPLPNWFSEVEQSYACGPQATLDGDVSEARLYIAGAGMVTRREIYDKLKRLKFSSQLVGRTGSSLASGEDVEFSVVAAIMGYRLVYSSKLILQHYMDSKRLTWDYLVKLTKGHGESSYILSLYKYLYTNGSIVPRWSNYFQQVDTHFSHQLNWRDKLYRLRQAVYWWVRQSTGKLGVEGDVESILAYYKMEGWVAHFKNKSQYKSRAIVLNELYKRLKSI
ncbi:MAG: glycosyltransferase family 2 protein [Sphingobacteriaceae bacterium]|nr:MAG: glycosyltransferase family 2 protein [Sphingobacteriaceae bacterium]